MKAKVVQDADVVTYVVVCDPGDEAVAALTEFARAEGLEASQVTAVGAFERATVGWFDRAAKEYREPGGAAQGGAARAGHRADRPGPTGSGQITGECYDQ